MEEDVLNALKSKMVMASGQDKDGNFVLIVEVPYNLQPVTKQKLELSIKYILGTLSADTLKAGLSILIDAQQVTWRQTKALTKFITPLLDNHLQKIIILRPDVFSVHNCAKAHKKSDPIFVSKSRLNKYFDLNELPIELGGLCHFNHEEWINTHIIFNDFKKLSEKTLKDIDGLITLLGDSNSKRPKQIEETLKICDQTNGRIQKSVKLLLDSGKKIINEISDKESNNVFLSRDIVNAKETVKKLLNDIEQRQAEVYEAWNELEKSLDDAKQFAQLEEGVVYVTNWILTTAESLLNGQLKVGHDIQTAEKLRLDHEIMEFQCWKIYGKYGELLHKICNFTGNKNSHTFKDLTSQRDFMDFVCRSFATRLERRRNVLITSVRFYRLVAEYFHRTAETFESLITQEVDVDFESARTKLQNIESSIKILGKIERDLIKEGEKLSDILSMPIKDALGRDINVDYSEDIANVREILDSTKGRSKIFSESMDLKKLEFEKIIHIHTYEKDAITANKWIESLFNVMIKSHIHVGCTVREIQAQKEEHQTFQETAKNTYNYGLQLYGAALALRQSGKLNCDNNIELTTDLKKNWQKFNAVSQEQMTRLRVSIVFHRSVEEQCTKLENLKTSVLELTLIDDTEKKKSKLRKYLSTRERLLVEVGRMVRLGRLLKTRLKEPFTMENQTEDEDLVIATADNSTACESIVEKLAEVSEIAESLDNVLRDTQEGLDIFESDVNDSLMLMEASERKLSSANNSDDWGSSIKSSTEDESFVTASEYTPSRSGSYHTASECRTSPWWTESVERNSTDGMDSSDPEQPPSFQLLEGISSSANVSFDDSDHCFLSPVSFGETTNNVDSFKVTKSDSEDHSGKEASPSDGHSSDSLSPDNKIYTIFESPVSTPSEKDSLEDIPKVSDSNNNIPELSGLSYYYQNIITKQVIRTCL